jgi:hypothetical protein
LAERVKGHPALLGYFTSDDANRGVTPGCHGASSALRDNGATIAAALRAVDPNHVLYISPGGWVSVSGLERTTQGGPAPLDCADIIGTQTYPIWGRVSSYQEALADVFRHGQTSREFANRYGQAYLHSLQAFRHDETGDDPTAVPTPSALRNMAMQALAAGAQGLIAFVYHKEGWHLPAHSALWAALGDLAREVQRLEPFLVGDRRVESLPTRDEAVVSGLITPAREPERRLLILANTAEAEREVTVIVPSAAGPMPLRRRLAEEEARVEELPAHAVAVRAGAEAASTSP